MLATPEQAKVVIEQSRAITVVSASDRQRAADLWDAIRAFRKQAEARKEEVCRPLKTAWDEAKRPFDAFIAECQSCERQLSNAMSRWDAEQQRLAEEAQRKIQARIDAENARKIARAEAKGQDPLTVVLKVAPVVPAPPKTLSTQAGTTQQRIEKTTYAIAGVETDTTVRADHPAVAQLLATYPQLFTLDWPAFRKLASTGVLDRIPGVERQTEYVYAQRAK